MGRKGVSKRKPKTSKSVSNQSAGASRDSVSVQSLMKDKSLPLSRSGVSPSPEKQKSK
jgi:hypothetical protein